MSATAIPALPRVGISRCRVEHVMGTVFSLDVRRAPLPTPALDAVLDQVVAWLHQVDATFSTYRPDSVVSRLARGEVSLEVAGPDVADVLTLCEAASRRSDGWFTATPHGALDPSGMVKGWAIERASEMLRAAGSQNHAVNGGGDVQTAGEAAPGRGWSVGITDPHRPGRILAVVTGVDIAVATSGTAERGAHIVDPRTGKAATALASLTVVGRSLTTVDADATAAFAMGEGARTWLGAQRDTEALGVTSTGDVWTTPGFAGSARANSPAC